MNLRARVALAGALGLVAFVSFPHSSADQPAAQPAAAPMEKYVSKDAIFLLYKPKGWTVTEGAQPGFQTISVTDPAGAGEAAMFLGTSPTGDDTLALAKRFLGGIGQQFPDLRIVDASVSRDKHRVFVSATFTHPAAGKRDFRCWLSGRGPEFMFESIETPAGTLDRNKALLLTILTNVRVFKGAFAAAGATPAVVPPLVPYRLNDGSASFQMPQGWGCQEFGKGCFLAGDAAAGYAFMVAAAEVITPKLGVRVPNVPVAPYQSPSAAFKMLCAFQGSVSNIKFESVISRNDVAQQMAQAYTVGPITAEEFTYTCDTKSGKTKGYTFGFTFGTRLDTNWSLRHLTVMAPAAAFDQSLPMFEAMLKSYTIDDQWARNYIAQGMIRLRQLQQQTSAMVARNAREIHDMMQAAYDERQRSHDYIDYKFTSYLRGEQDWVSGMEGGTVYHSDSWGTRNTTTGETWEGQPYDYVNFNGRNPGHNEDMTPIDSRALWERHIAP